MLRLTVISFLMSIAVSGYAQIDASEAMKMRDSIFKHYQRHSDTMTKNTWLNIMLKNKYLNEIVSYDSLIFESIQSDDRLDSLVLAVKQQLKSSELNLKAAESEKRQAEQNMVFYKKMYVMLLIVAVLFLVIIIVLIGFTARLNKSLKDKDKQVKSYYTDLNKARQEIENSRKTENQLASEINKLKRQIDSGIENSGDDVEKLREEKLMIENQIIEIKKAYELEVGKRMDLETLVEEMEQNDDSEVVNNLNNKLEGLQAENDSLKHELEELGKVKNELDERNAEHQKLYEQIEELTRTRESAEEKLSELITKIKMLTNDF